MAKIKVRDKLTGKIIEVDESELGKFGLSNTSQKTTTPSTGSDEVFGRLTQGEGLLQSIFRPFTKSADAIAGAATELGRAGISAIDPTKGGFDNPFIQESDFDTGAQGMEALRRTLDFSDKQGKAARGSVEDQLRASAGVASFAVPFGKGGNLLTKTLLPGAGAGALSALSEDDADVGDIVLGSVGGSGGALAFPFLGKALSKLKPGRALQAIGNRLAESATRVSPSQGRKFTQKSGQKLGEFLQSKNLVGKSSDEIMERTIRPLQKKFNQIAKNKNITLTEEEIAESMLEEVAPILDSPATDNQRLLNQIFKEYDFVLKNLNKKKGSITFDDATKLRREFDSLVKDFLTTDPTKAGKNRVVANALRKSIQKKADSVGLKVGDKTFKQLGRELSDLYSAEEIIFNQEFLGRGSLPAGITDLLSVGAGSTLGGPVGGALGGLLSIAGKSAPVVGAVSKAATQAGKGISKAGQPLSNVAGAVQSRMPQISSQVTGQASAQTGAELLDNIVNAGQLPTVDTAPKNNATNNNQSDNIQQGSDVQFVTDSNNNTFIQLPGGQLMSEDRQWLWDAEANDWKPSGIQTTQSVQQGGISPQMIEQMTQAAFMSGSPKALSFVDSFITTQGKIQKMKEAQIGGDKEQIQKIETIEEQVDKIDDLLTSGKISTGRIGGTFEKVQSALGLDPSLRELKQLSLIAAPIIGKNILELGRLTDEDVQLALSSIPNETDTPQEIQAKLTNLRDLLKKAKNSPGSPESSESADFIEMLLQGGL